MMNNLEDLKTLESFVRSDLFHPTLSNKFLVKTEMRVILLSQFELDVGKNVFKAKGFILVEKEVLPVEMYYIPAMKKLSVYIQDLKVTITLDEMMKKMEMRRGG